MFRSAPWAAIMACGLALGVAAQEAAAPVDGAVGPRTPVVAMVNGAAVVENSRAARALRATERDLRERAQAENDHVQAELEAEERELARLREEIPVVEFEARAAAFDRRVRAERRRAQERGALLVTFVQEARGALLSALPRVLEELRRDAGATMIIDAGAVLAIEPSLDLTATAIARYDAAVGEVRFDPPPNQPIEAPPAEP